MSKIIMYHFLFLGLFFSLQAQQNLLQSGPMLGPMTLRDASIWVQTKASAAVTIGYKKEGAAEPYKLTPKALTSLEHGFTATIHLPNLVPNTTYEYQIFINDQVLSFEYPTTFTTQTHWQYRTSPPDFTFIAGSCVYINDPDFERPGKFYGSGYGIFKQMALQKPNFMVWLGDNTYLREGDFESRSGIYYRQTHTRSLPEMQPYLASQPNYAIWDDHDYGPNDSDWTYPLKKHALQAFKEFWPSESYGAGETEGVTSHFVYNDCAFFMLDNRWYRTVEQENGTILGEQQKYWLKEALRVSKASYKFIAVGGQFLSDFASFENFALFPNDRNEIIDFIDEYQIKNVVFLTGDRHHSEISKLTTPKGQIIYDVTSSSLTSGTYDHRSEPNTLRVPNSMVIEQNFAVFSVSGDIKNRKLSVQFKNKEGLDMGKYDLSF